VRLLVGDVRGKGLDAVRKATIVLGEFRAAAVELPDLVDVARQIDRRVAPYFDDEDFVTAIVAEITDRGDVMLASCGHPPALLAEGETVREVGAEGSLPLGLGAAPSVVSFRLQPGNRLLLYTDGILEARDRWGRFVDFRRLVEPLGTGDFATVLDRMLGSLEEFVGGALGDDLALLVAEYRPV
jgi:serine phosphatase RsbU (regulator of sigma subunit)